MNLNHALNLFGLNNLENVDETMLKLTYIKLAKTKHPDKSGSHEEFVALKAAHEMLLAILKQKKSNLPDFLYSDNTSLTANNYQVLKSQYELLETTKVSINNLIDKMQSRKKQIELTGIEELKDIEREIDGNVWYKMSKTFLNKYPQSYYDKKTALRIKSQNLKNSVDKQIFREIISEYSKTMDNMTYYLTLIDSDINTSLDNSVAER
ncbi:MAG: hypothetical protein ACRCXZ_04955 [Patescibacteria group bacterium]